jgi:hypothetical protein
MSIRNYYIDIVLLMFCVTASSQSQTEYEFAYQLEETERQAVIAANLPLLAAVRIALLDRPSRRSWTPRP